jgi:hypothetical protein
MTADALLLPSRIGPKSPSAGGAEHRVVFLGRCILVELATWAGLHDRGGLESLVAGDPALRAAFTSVLVQVGSQDARAWHDWLSAGDAQVVIQRQAMVKGRDVGADEFDDRRIGFLSRRAWIIPSRVSTPRRPPALSSTGNSCRVVWIRHCTTSSTRLSGVIARDHRIRHRHPARDLPQLSLALTDIKGVKPLRALIAPSCTPGTCTQLA